MVQTPEAHSTLLVNGKGDAELRGRYGMGKTQEYRMNSAWEDNTIECASDFWERWLTVLAPTK